MQKKKLWGGLALIAFSVALISCGILWQKQVQYAKEMQELQELQVLQAQYSFYQKLSEGLDVSILVVGDSIGAGAGAQTSEKKWANQLSAFITEEYGSAVTLTNVSMGGNTSYAGYVRTMMLEDGIDYDLVVVCYGQNDDNDDFAFYYESMLRAIQNKFAGCTVISILESSQRDYTAKMLTIQSLAEYYNIEVADTIAAFAQSGYEYDALTDDGVHPNDLGYTIYFETVQAILLENLAQETTNTTQDATLPPVDAQVTTLENCIYYSVDNFERVDDVTYTLAVAVAENSLGIYYSPVSGENKVELFADGVYCAAREVTWNYTFTQTYIKLLTPSVTAQETITLVFATQEQADTFKGIALSGAIEF